MYIVYVWKYTVTLFFLADKNDSNESDDENELLTKETSVPFITQGTDEKVNHQNMAKNKKVNIVK